VVQEIASSVSKSGGAGTGSSEPVTAAYTTRSVGRGLRAAKDKTNRYCAHCRRSGHNTDQCFKVVGYPDWYKGVREPLKGRASPRVAANVIGQVYSDNPLEDVTNNTKDVSTAGQVDAN